MQMHTNAYSWALVKVIRILETDWKRIQTRNQEHGVFASVYMFSKLLEILLIQVIYYMILNESHLGLSHACTWSPQVGHSSATLIAIVTWFFSIENKARHEIMDR